MKAFREYHPIVNLIYFAFGLISTMFFMHPVCLAISFISAIIYMSIGKSETLKTIYMIIPTVLFMAILNPLFNHQGMTILVFLPSGNPLTLESIFYGILSGVMLVAVIGHTMSASDVITSDKTIYLFGKVLPSLALLISMALRFVPKFKEEFTRVKNAHACLGTYKERKSVLAKVKSAVSILSIMVTWSLKNAIDTSDSMKSRGYGTGKRGAYSIFNFKKRDAIALIVMLLLIGVILWGAISGELYFSAYPKIKMAETSPFNIAVFIAYALFFMVPLYIEIREVIKWKHIESKT